MIEYSSDAKAVVDRNYFWRKIDGNTPERMKIQLISKSSGVACYGTYVRSEKHWTHWAPLPVFEKE